MQLGDLKLIALAGEVVTDYSLRLKKEFGGNTWVAGYSNDLYSYIASARMYAEGGYEVVESLIPRATLYTADEVFFSGTAAEITPIRTIDRIKIGEGKRGPITAALQKEFFAITSGEKEAPGDWLSFVK